MLCKTCRLRLPTRRTFALPQSRSIQTVPSSPNAAPSETPSPTTNPTQPPPALSSLAPGKSQPLSTPILPSTSTSTSKPHPSKPPPAPRKLQSSIPGGMPLHGLAYLKNKPAVLAMEDDQYPEWLWTLLDTSSSSSTSSTSADLAAMTKKQRARYDKKQEKLLKGMPKKIPLHEQSKDLTGPGDDAVVSLERRQDVTKSSRVARRKAIREDNFLRGM